MKAPFPWFGGKRRVADVVWAALGDVDNYIEPFAGSLAVLLERPEWHTGTCETVNDADRYVANFWRALALAPEEVARHADWPVNEADLEARHLWLVNEGRERVARMFDDPEFFDPKVAGWWVWGVSAWIGSGWCSGNGPHKQGDAGRGINRQLPHLGDAGRGINRQLPHLSDAGQGINRQLPHLGDAGQGINDYMQALAARLRQVRVCCGDWARVVTDGATSYGASVGVFLDPPYSGGVRAGLYTVDDHTISAVVREWALAKGDDPRFRIVLAGYAPEHEAHMPVTWACHAWSATGAYKGGGDNDKNAEVNRHLERLWFSPHCIRAKRPSLFAEARL